MSLEFIVIAYNPKCEEYSENIVTNLNRCKNISVKLDINYDQTINTRQNKYKKDEKDIILIDEVCLINSEVIVKYSDKGSKSKRYNKNEFIDLIESFETNLTNKSDNNISKNNTNKKNEYSIEEEDTDNNNCLLM